MPGVYALALSRKPLSGKPFSWLPEIIYVGMTNSKPGLGSRLKQFDDTIAQRRSNHGGAERVLFKHRNYPKLVSRLFVAVAPVFCNVRSNAPRDLRLMGKVAEFEFICLARYAQRHGTLPEFNDKARSLKE